MQHYLKREVNVRLMVKTIEARSAGNRAIYMVIEVNTDDIKEVLGLWTAPTEGAKF